jgi:hypothetical protein
MSEPEATFVELGKRLVSASSLPEGITQIQARVATLKHVNDARVQREAAAELGREAVRLHGLALVPGDLRDRVREHVGGSLGPVEESGPTATQQSVPPTPRPQPSLKQKPSSLSKYAGPAGFVLLILLARIAWKVDWTKPLKPPAPQPSRAIGSAGRKVGDVATAPIDPLIHRNWQNRQKARDLAQEAKRQFSWGTFEDDIAERINLIRNGDNAAKANADTERSRAIEIALSRLDVGVHPRTTSSRRASPPPKEEPRSANRDLKPPAQDFHSLEITATNDEVGSAVQALQRAWRVDKSLQNPNSALGLFLDAYQRGRSQWIDHTGRTRFMAELNLPELVWPDEGVDPPYEEGDPFIEVVEDDTGTRITMAPIAVGDALFCGITFKVISRVPNHRRAEEWDYLAANVELFGGKKFQLNTAPIPADTRVEFVGRSSATRITLSKWAESEPVGHVCSSVYAPLLYEVLAAGPDVFGAGDFQRPLSSKFRAGCKELCSNVMKARTKQGQEYPPKCKPPRE